MARLQLTDRESRRYDESPGYARQMNRLAEMIAEREKAPVEITDNFYRVIHKAEG